MATKKSTAKTAPKPAAKKAAPVAKPAAKPAETASGPTQDELVSAAEDLSEVLKLEPALDTALTGAEMVEQIKTAGDLAVPEDELAASTWATMAACGCSVKQAVSEAPAKGKPAAAKAPKAPKPPKAPAYTRLAAMGELYADASLTCLDTEAAAKAADDLYVANGGTSNIKEAKTVANVIVKFLAAAGLATVDNGVITLA